MFELFCKISFFLFMLVMYAYVTSTIEVVIIILGYICCVFSYYYFRTIKTAIDELLNHINNYGIFKTNFNRSHVSNYAVSKKYNKVNNAVNVPTLNNKIFVPVCRNNNAFSTNSPAVFNCKFNNFIMNGDLPSKIMTNGLFVENGNKIRENMKSTIQNMEKSCNNSATLRFRSDSKSAHNPFSANKKHNNNLDMETYMNVNSPGFTSRIVDKAMESASYHIKYPAVKQISTYRFDKSTLRHLSKIPRMNSTPLVRIAPPEPISIHLLNDMEKKFDKNEALEPNFLQVLKDISRKRNFSQEETEKNSGTAKKSRKNDIKNLTISQYKRSLDDKSRDVLEDKIKKRCEDHKRDAAKMVVYAPCIISPPDCSSQSYSKKRKSSNKSKNECWESTEKYRKIHKSSKEACVAENSNEQKSKECNLTTCELPTNESKPVAISDQRFKQSRDEPVEDENIEYVHVAGGKILNRTNRSYRRKLNSNKIDPVSVIASEPEIVGEITGTDDVSMKEHLLQNLLSNIEKKGHKDEKVILYENSILTDVAKNHVEYEEPPQQVPNPLFTDSVVSNEDEIELTDSMNVELKESPINTAHSSSNISYTTAAIHHSTPITSNTVSRDSIHNANYTTTPNVFKSGSSFINVSNVQNSTDSGYDSSFDMSRNLISPYATSSTLANSCDKLKFNSTKANGFKTVPISKTISINSSDFSFGAKNDCNLQSKITNPASSGSSFNHFSENLFTVSTQSCFASRNSAFGPLNSLNSKVQPLATFGSGDGNFFNPANKQSALNSSLSSQIEDRHGDCNLGISTKNYSNTFGCKDGRTLMQFEPSFSSIAMEYPKNPYAFRNGEVGVPNSATNPHNQANFSFSNNTSMQSNHPHVPEKNLGSTASITFNIGTGGSLRNRAARNTRNK